MFLLPVQMGIIQIIAKWKKWSRRFFHFSFLFLTFAFERVYNEHYRHQNEKNNDKKWLKIDKRNHFKQN